MVAQRLLHPKNGVLNGTVAQIIYFALNGANGMRRDAAVNTISTCEAKNGFGLMINTVHAEPVLSEKHGRCVVVALLGEEYQRLSARAERKETGMPPAQGGKKIAQ